MLVVASFNGSTRANAERLSIVDGSPAGVLAMTLPSGLAAIFAFIGFVLALWRYRKDEAKRSTPTQ